MADPRRPLSANERTSRLEGRVFPGNGRALPYVWPTAGYPQAQHREDAMQPTGGAGGQIYEVTNAVAPAILSPGFTHLWLDLGDEC